MYSGRRTGKRALGHGQFGIASPSKRAGSLLLPGTSYSSDDAGNCDRVRVPECAQNKGSSLQLQDGMVCSDSTNTQDGSTQTLNNWMRIIHAVRHSEVCVNLFQFGMRQTAVHLRGCPFWVNRLNCTVYKWRWVLEAALQLRRGQVGIAPPCTQAPSFFLRDTNYSSDDPGNCDRLYILEHAQTKGFSLQVEDDMVSSDSTNMQEGSPRTLNHWMRMFHAVRHSEICTNLVCVRRMAQMLVLRRMVRILTIVKKLIIWDTRMQMRILDRDDTRKISSLMVKSWERMSHAALHSRMRQTALHLRGWLCRKVSFNQTLYTWRRVLEPALQLRRFQRDLLVQSWLQWKVKIEVKIKSRTVYNLRRVLEAALHLRRCQFGIAGTCKRAGCLFLPDTSYSSDDPGKCDRLYIPESAQNKGFSVQLQDGMVSSDSTNMQDGSPRTLNNWMRILHAVRHFEICTNLVCVRRMAQMLVLRRMVRILTIVKKLIIWDTRMQMRILDRDDTPKISSLMVKSWERMSHAALHSRMRQTALHLRGWLSRKVSFNQTLYTWRRMLEPALQLRRFQRDLLFQNWLQRKVKIEVRTDRGDFVYNLSPARTTVLDIKRLVLGPHFENTKQHFWIQWQNTVLTDQLTLSQNGIETNAILKFQVRSRGGADGEFSSQEAEPVSNGRAKDKS